MVRNSGGRMSLLGTGRVMSQTRMHAVFLPRAISASGREPMGLAMAAAMAAAGSASGAAGRMDSGPTIRSAGKLTSSPVLP
jgi:hypothetical protein